jgi:hypothetical protein
MSSWRRLILCISATVVATAVTACDFTRDFQQTVSIHIEKSGSPLAGIQLRYYAQAQCGGSFVAAMTNGDGRADVVRVAKRGRLAVVLEKPSLCILQESRWTPVWSTTQDPPERVAVSCDVTEAGKWKCA